MRYKQFTRDTLFRVKWAEGYEDKTEPYVGKELSLSEFLYIITKRHHEIALEMIADGSYGCYDKHMVEVKYDKDSEWEVLDRFDLGSEYDWKYIFDDLCKSLTKLYETSSFSELVKEGQEKWSERSA